MVKRCGRCREDLPEEAFNRAGQGRQHWCRDCFRDYFRDRGEAHRAQVATARDARRDPLRRRILEHFAAHPCVDCGERDPRVLEFDHLGKKRDNVSALLNRGVPLRELDAEIARCDVVCANCHRRRSAGRAHWGRVTGADPEDANVRPRRLRNLRWVYASLEKSMCADCGLADPLLLEHDHIDAKRAGVMTLAWSEYSIEQLQVEIRACEIRCCNCHRRRTSVARACFRAEAVTLAAGL